MTAAFGEMKSAGTAAVRLAYAELSQWLSEISLQELDFRQREAELLFRRIGITFAVYGDAEAQERLIPFDVIPRILAASEWDLLCRGLEQRVKALNFYIKDVYGLRDIVRAGVVPGELVFENPVFRPEMNNQKVPHDVYVHIAGIDIVRVDAKTFYVLEDNARTPSGVSYMLENREIIGPPPAYATGHCRQRFRSSLPQALLLVSQQRRQQELDNPPLAGLDLHGHRHAGRQLDHPLVDLHLRAIKRDTRGVEKLLPRRLAGAHPGARGFVGIELARRLVADHGILGKANDPAMQQPVSGEVEGVDLDLRRIAFVNEADVLVGHHGFDLDPAPALWQEYLRRRHAGWCLNTWR